MRIRIFAVLKCSLKDAMDSWFQMAEIVVCHYWSQRICEKSVH